MVRKDRAGSRIGGGVAVICRNDWRIQTLELKESFESEAVWCKIITPNSEYHVASVYHDIPFTKLLIFWIFYPIPVIKYCWTIQM